MNPHRLAIICCQQSELENTIMRLNSLIYLHTLYDTHIHIITTTIIIIIINSHHRVLILHQTATYFSTTAKTNSSFHPHAFARIDTKTKCTELLRELESISLRFLLKAELGSAASGSESWHDWNVRSDERGGGEW